MARIAASRPNEPEHDERRRCAAGSRLGGCAGRRRPPRPPRPSGPRSSSARARYAERVEAVELEPPLTAVGHRPVAHVTATSYAWRPDRGADGVGEDPPDSSTGPPRLRELDALLDRLPSPLREPSGAQNRRARGWRPPCRRAPWRASSAARVTPPLPTDHEFHPGLRELTARRQRLEERNEPPRLARSRLRRAAGTPEDLGEPAERLALLQPLTERAPQRAAPPARPRSPRRCRRSGSTRRDAARADPRARAGERSSPNRSARAYCAAASRWAPRDAARAAAAGA